MKRTHQKMVSDVNLYAYVHLLAWERTFYQGTLTQKQKLTY